MLDTPLPIAVFPNRVPKTTRAIACPRPPLPDTPETRFDTAAYKTCVRILDTEIGRVLNAIDRAGLADNTLVISTTDHGIAFPMMKCNLTDHGIGVLLIMRGPGFSGGKVIDGMVSQIDLFPTLCGRDRHRPSRLAARQIHFATRAPAKRMRSTKKFLQKSTTTAIATHSARFARKSGNTSATGTPQRARATSTAMAARANPIFSNGDGGEKPNPASNSTT